MLKNLTGCSVTSLASPCPTIFDGAYNVAATTSGQNWSTEAGRPPRYENPAASNPSADRASGHRRGLDVVKQENALSVEPQSLHRQRKIFFARCDGANHPLPRQN